MRLNIPSPRIILEKPELVVTAINELYASVETLRRDLAELKREVDTAGRRTLARENALADVQDRVKEMDTELRRMDRGGGGGSGPGREPPPRGRRLRRR